MRSHIPAFCALILASTIPALNAQIFSLGVKAGVPITEAYSAVSTANSGSEVFRHFYVIGPTAEIHFPLGFSLEADALYRRNGVTASGSIEGRSNVNDWQFPILGKYEFKHNSIRPFIDAGAVYRRLSTKAIYNLAFSSGSSNTTQFEYQHNLAGVSVGCGITLKFMMFRLSPEIRYTRWLNAVARSSLDLTAVNGDQADFLVGFTF